MSDIDDLRREVNELKTRLDTLRLSSLDSASETLSRAEFVSPVDSSMTNDPTSAEFTGIFRSAKGYTFSGVVYHWGLVLLGVLQVGASYLGQWLAGAGKVLADVTGLTIDVATTAGPSGSDPTVLKFGDIIRVWGEKITNTSKQAWYVVCGTADTVWNAVIDMTASGGTTTGDGQIKFTATGGGNTATLELLANSAGASVTATPHIIEYGFPQSCIVTALEYATAVTTAITVNSNFIFNFIRGPSSANANDGDEYTFSFVLAAGTYTLTVNGQTSADCGIVDYYLDGAVLSTGEDWYSLAPATDVSKTQSVVIATGGRHTLKVKVNGQNGGATDYRWLNSHIEFTKSAYTVDA